MKEFIQDSVYHIVHESIAEFFRMSSLTGSPREKGMHPDNRDDHQRVKERDAEWRYGAEKYHEKYLEERFKKDKGYNICHSELRKVLASSEYKKLIKMARSYKKKVIFEDSGFRLSVPKAISGEDKCFSVHKNSSRPTVKIAINVCGSCIVEDKTFAKLAATAIPTIYALEQAGIPTEVWYTAFVTGCHKDDRIKHTAAHVKLKSAQERFNWITFAPVFTLGSYRESVFLSLIYSRFEVGSGLGCPTDSSVIREYENFGYASVIGLNGPGPVTEITSIFDGLFKHSKDSPTKKAKAKPKDRIAL